MERYRSQVSSVVIPSSLDGDGRSRTFAKSKEMTDVVTPGYFRMAREGQTLPVNPCTINEYGPTDAVTVGSYDEYYVGRRTKVCPPTYKLQDSHTYYGCLAYDMCNNITSLSPTGGYVNVDTVSGLCTANQLVPEALAEARLKDMDVLTTLAELRKTTDLLVGVRDRVRKRAERITDRLRRKGKLTAIAPKSASLKAHIHRLATINDARLRNSVLDAFYDTWMEDRYGWRILLFEIEDAWDTWLKYQAGVGPIVKGKAECLTESLGYDKSGTSTTLTTPAGSRSFASCSYRLQKGVSGCRTVGLGYQFALETLLTIDPVVTALELVKFSFVADWFTNLGDIVRAYSPFGMGKVLWLWTTTETRNFVRVTVQPTGSYYDYRQVCPTTASLWESAYVRRQRSPLVWNDHVPEIRFFNDLDLPKVIDILSILRGLGSPLKPWMRV